MCLTYNTKQKILKYKGSLKRCHQKIEQIFVSRVINTPSSVSSNCDENAYQHISQKW